VCRAGGGSLPRLIMGLADDPDRLVCYVNGNGLDLRRENLVVRTRSEVAKARQPTRKWDQGFEPYVDPDQPSVVRIPILTETHKGMEALIDAADFPLVQGKKWNWSPGKPDPAKNGSVVLRINGTPKPSLARIILGVEDPEQLVCHRNRDRLDCRRANLVLRDRAQVQRARKKSLVKNGSACSSRFKGVTRSESGRKWYAAINVGGKYRNLGRFRSEIDAALAYDAALRELMGDDVAGLNLPDPAEVQRLRALEPVVEDGPFPPPGMVDRHEACRMFGVSLTTWIVWERRGRITCGQYHALPNDKPGRCKLYPKVELERARVEIEKLGKPYPDPEQPGVWRVPLKSYLAHREVLIDEVDLPIVQGRNWNWTERSDDSGRTEGTVILATTGRQAPLHRMIAGVSDPKIRVSFVNGDALDCRRSNLAVRTLAETAQASRKMETRAGKECTSRFKGVTWHADRGKWAAQIRKDEVHRSIGRFDDEEAAAQAYDDCARVWFGEHAFVNFPERATTDAARAWAEGVIDGTAVRERRRKFRRRRMEKALRRAAREAARREQMRVLGERDPWAADDAWTRDPSVPKVGRHEARKLFGVSLNVWKRWQRIGWITCGQVTTEGRRVYPLAEIERLLEVCGRLRPPYPDPDRPGVWRVPLFGRKMQRKEVLIDRSSLKLIEGGRCTLGATKTDRGHVSVWFPAKKAHVTLRRLITGVADPDAGDASCNVQHRNGDLLDCRRENLVVRTAAQRTHTSRKVKHVKGSPPTSRFKGVCWHKGGKKWCASISVGKQSKYLGLYEREEDAAEAYDRAARTMFGPHAYFNFPREERESRLVQAVERAA
jgi:hypothetical protein